MKNSIVLRQAKDVILTDGWTRGIEGMAVTGPACLLGAIGRAAGIDGAPSLLNRDVTSINMEKVVGHPAAKALAKCISREWRTYDPESSDVVWRFNDRGTTNRDIALRVLNDCANAEEEAGR